MAGELAKAVCEVYKAVKNVPRTGKNSFHNYEYASEADFLRAVQPAMAAAGLVMLPISIQPTVTPGPKTSRGKEQTITTVLVTYRLIHTSGEQQDIQAIGAGIDGEEKGVFKAMTGALKYALRQTFLVPTGDDPDAGADHDPAPPAELPAFFVDGLKKMDFTAEYVDGLLSWMQDRTVRTLDMQPDKLHGLLKWLAGEEGTDKVVAYMKHLEGGADEVEPAKAAKADEHHRSWEREANAFGEYLAELGLDIHKVSAWCRAKDKPAPPTMDSEQRSKLLAYLRDANGAAQVKAWAAEQAAGAATETT